MPKPRRRKLFLILLFVFASAAILLALLLPVLTTRFDPPPQAGQVAAQDYHAPLAKTYTSQVKTDRLRQEAEAAVQTIYTPVDTGVARQQLERLRAALAYITSVRLDAHASASQKMQDLAALEDIHLSQETAASLLDLSDSRWQTAQGEALVVLEKAMSSQIRPQDLEAARLRLPSLVSLAVPENQVGLVAELASAFLASNSQPSQDLTDAARQKARDAVEPIEVSYAADQTVVQRGQVLNLADVEALEQLGLIEGKQDWTELLASALITLLMAALCTFYLVRRPNLITGGLRNLALVVLLLLVFLFGARLAIPAHTIIPYAFPLPAFSLTVAALFGPQPAMIFSLPLAVLAAFNLPISLDLTLYYLISGLFGILALGRARRIGSFFWSGILVAVSGSIVIISYRLLMPSTDLAGLATLSGAAFINGLASASLAVLLQYLLAQPLRMTTPIQLADLTRPDQPLLQLILREAPGTYQHSLQLANLAEQAAERIGADPLLTRVGALYHDAGKARNPAYFIENQAPGFPNPHEQLDPATSAAVIIQHVADGLGLGRQYRLPRRILDFIAEHHGTLLTRYQYVRAVKENGGDEATVDKEQFRYPGPTPQSRETAILMLADGCEARVRAEMPKSDEELRAVIKSVMDDRVGARQLDHTRLTLNDLEVIEESFISTLRGMYHPRLPYPSLEQPAENEVSAFGYPSATSEVTRPRSPSPLATLPGGEGIKPAPETKQ